MGIRTPVVGFEERPMLKARFSLAMLIGLSLLPTAILAQLKTIPTLLAEHGNDLRSGASVPSGAAPDLDVILRDTDLIVRGVVGNPRSYLSDDQMTIFSDYPIVFLKR
jgi:hypothetical protein